VTIAIHAEDRTYLRKYNRMVTRFRAVWAVILLMVVCASCKRSIDNQEAVRQGVIDYLSKRSNLNISGMNVDVTSVSFRQNEADAMVAITAKGANPGQPMSMRYTLERQSDRWVVKGKTESGGSPHGSAGANPHGAAAPMPGGELPPGHPSVDGAKPKP
jgi:hypothetical protein